MDGSGTEPRETAERVRPWSARTLLPRTMLTLVRVRALPEESMKLEERQRGKGRASSLDQRISVTGVGVCEAEMMGSPLPVAKRGSTSGWPRLFCVGAWGERTG